MGNWAARAYSSFRSWDPLGTLVTSKWTSRLPKTMAGIPKFQGAGYSGHDFENFGTLSPSKLQQNKSSARRQSSTRPQGPRYQYNMGTLSELCIKLLAVLGASGKESGHQNMPSVLPGLHIHRFPAPCLGCVSVKGSFRWGVSADGVYVRAVYRL